MVNRQLSRSERWEFEIYDRTFNGKLKKKFVPKIWHDPLMFFRPRYDYLRGGRPAKRVQLFSEDIWE